MNDQSQRPNEGGAMIAIWKYEITPGRPLRLQMPKGARVLDVQSQMGKPVMWAEVDTDAEMVERELDVFGTGWEIPDIEGVDRKYVGTFQVEDGHLVFHVYERRRHAPMRDLVGTWPGDETVEELLDALKK